MRENPMNGRHAGVATLALAVVALQCVTLTCVDNGSGGGTGEYAAEFISKFNRPPDGGDTTHIHTWGSWVETTPATCEVAGVEERTCTQDASHKDTRDIAKLTGSACAPTTSTKTTFVDTRDNTTYWQVTIGSQTWMAENLNYEIADGTGSWCYINKPDNCAKYGRLYNWNTARGEENEYSPSGYRDVCPGGWHLPSRAEWDTLASRVGGNGYGNESGLHLWYDAGKHLKSKSGWNSFSGIVNEDTYGFSALPGGERRSYDGFYDVGNLGQWWTTEECSSGSGIAYSRHMDYNADSVLEDADLWSRAFSVRCVQD